MRIMRIVPAFVALLCLSSSVARAEGPFEGKTSTLKFVEGVIVKGNVNSHSRLSTDLVSGVLMDVGKPLVNDLLDSFFAAAAGPATAPATALTTNAPAGTAGTALTIVTQPPADAVPTMTTTGTGAVVITLPPGAHPPSSTGSGASIAQEIRDAAKQENQPYVPGAAAPIGVGFSIDSFWVGAGAVNNRFEADMKVDWDFTKDDLNKINAALKLNQLAGAATSLGIVKMETGRTRFLRQAGARFDIGIDLKWKNQWKNNIVNVNVTDVAVEIDDSQTVDLGTKKHDYSDSVNVSDLPGVIMGLVEKVSEKLATQAGSAAAKEAGDSLAEQIFDNLEIGVLVTNTTYDRSIDVTFSVDARDIAGKELHLPLVDAAASFAREGAGHGIVARLPSGCLPLQSVTLKVVSATYHYKELQNIELGISASHIPVELRTGIATEDIAKMFEATHAAAARDEDKPWMTVEADPLAYVPFHGIVVTGDPAYGLAGVTVELSYDGKVRATTLTGPDGTFWDDRYVGSPSGAKPASTVTVRKDGFPDSDIVFVNDTDGYRITMSQAAANYIQVSGRVTDAAGNPLEGAEVHAMSGSDVYVATDAQGAYAFPRILKTGKVTVSVFKNGLTFRSVERSVGKDDQALTVDFTPTAEMPLGTFIMDLKKVGGAALPKAVTVKKGGKEFSAGVGGDATVRLPIVSPREQFTISAEGFALDPSALQAQMNAGQYGQENRTDITAMPLFAQSVVLSIEPGGRTAIEAGGVQAPDDRPEENATLAALVKDAVGNPMPNVPVRFEAAAASGKTAVKFSNEGLRPGCGYAMTDASGTARVGVKAYSVLGNVTLTAVATDAYIASGDDSDQKQSNALTLSIIASTRAVQASNPVAGVIAYTNKKAVDGRAVPTIETGGEMIFHLSGTPGNGGAGGRINGYRLGYEKDGDAADAPVNNGAVPATARKTFAAPGAYQAVFQVRERYGDRDLWSEKASAGFEVVAFTPPQVALTVPAAGVAGQRLDLSFQVTVAAPFKRILLTFGDAAGQDVDLDAGLLTGRLTWSGTPYHIYAAAGTYTVTLKATDINDRATETKKTVTIAPVAVLNDTTAPTAGITINNGAQTTASRSVGVRVTASDNAGGTGVFRFRLSNDGVTWGAWQSANFPADTPVMSMSSDKAWTLSDGSGLKTVYAQVKDAADNVAPAVSATITYANTVGLGGASGDGSSPGIYPGNDQAMYTWDTQAPTGSITVTGTGGGSASLALVMNDGGTAPHPRMCFSANGTAWTAWEEFAPSKDISVASGQAKVYVKYVDGVGNMSPAYSAVIPAVASQTQTQTQAQSQAQETTSAAADAARQEKKAAEMKARQEKKAAELKARQEKKDAELKARQEKRVEDEKIRQAKKDAEQKARQEKKEAGAKVLEAKKALPPAALEEKKAAVAQVSGEKDDAGIWTGAVKREPASKTRQVKPKKEAPVLPATPEKINLLLSDALVPADICAGKKCVLEVYVRNESAYPVKECLVSVKTEDGYKDEEKVRLGAHGRQRARFSWTPKKEGLQDVVFTLVYKDDAVASDNEVVEKADVKAPPATPPAQSGAVAAAKGKRARKDMPSGKTGAPGVKGVETGEEAEKVDH